MTTKLSEQNKQTIIELIEAKKTELRSYDAVANFCGVSSAVINLMRNNKYATQGDTKWLEVGMRLGFKVGTSTGKRDWKTVDTLDYKSIAKVCADAKNNSLFLAIAECGGAGKSEALKHFAALHNDKDVYYLRCMDWGKTEFLEQFCKALGIQAANAVRKPNQMLDLIIDFFQQRSLYAPVVLLDEANKLKDAAIRCLIPLHNECEDFLGVVMAGPEDLKKYIETAVRYRKRGFDEIYSRFGRTFINLLGCTEREVIAICKANGYTNETRIKEKFEQHKPVSKLVEIGGKQTRIRVIRDLRWIKTFVKVNRNKTNE